MLDRILTAMVALAHRRLSRPVVVFCFTAEPEGFSTRFDGSKDVTHHHIQGAATDLLRLLADDKPAEGTCPCCVARHVRIATALEILTTPTVAQHPAVH